MLWERIQLRHVSRFLKISERGYRCSENYLLLIHSQPLVASLAASVFMVTIRRSHPWWRVSANSECHPNDEKSWFPFGGCVESRSTARFAWFIYAPKLWCFSAHDASNLICIRLTHLPCRTVASNYIYL